jgi:hypothetical protein
MADTSVLTSAKRDASTAIRASIAIAVVCTAVLGVNWKYLYNFAEGPFRFDAALAASPGPREFVRAEGAFMPTGWAQESTLRLLRGLVETRSTNAQYLAMLVDDRLLIVKAPVDFGGRVIEGRLVELPAAIQASLGTSAPSYPWMIQSTTGYRWDFNLFVLIAAPLFVIAVALLVSSLWQSGNVVRHPMIGQLARYGEPVEVARTIDAEVRAAAAGNRIGPAIVTPAWLVARDPYLHIVPLQDLVSAGVRTTTSKSGSRYDLLCWTRGRSLADKIRMDLGHARKVLERIAARDPGAVVEDVAAFEHRWRVNRDACEQEAADRAARA